MHIIQFPEVSCITSHVLGSTGLCLYSSRFLGSSVSCISTVNVFVVMLKMNGLQFLGWTVVSISTVKFTGGSVPYISTAVYKKLYCMFMVHFFTM